MKNLIKHKKLLTKVLYKNLDIVMLLENPLPKFCNDEIQKTKLTWSYNDLTFSMYLIIMKYLKEQVLAFSVINVL